MCTVELVHDHRKCGKADHEPHPGISDCGRPLLAREAWSLQELDPEVYEMAVKLGATEAQLARLAGNSIPLSMLLPIARAIRDRLELIDRVQAGDTSFAASHSQSQPSSVTTLLVIYSVKAQLFFVETSDDGIQAAQFFPTLQHPAPFSRDSSVKAAQQLIPSHILDAFPCHTYLAGERLAELELTRVCVLPTVDNLPIDGEWLPLSSLLEELVPIALTAQLAAARYGEVESAPAPYNDSGEGFATGADGPTRVAGETVSPDTTPLDFEKKPVVWLKQTATSWRLHSCKLKRSVAMDTSKASRIG